MAPKALRRPAGAAAAKAAAPGMGQRRRGGVPGVLRRPAAALGVGAHPLKIETGVFLVGEASYYGQKGQVAGQVKEEREEEGRRMILAALTGTPIDPLLQWATQGEAMSRWHLCGPGCPLELEAEGLVHVMKSRIVTPAEMDNLGWASNLKPATGREALEDENAGLRKRLDELQEKYGERRSRGRDPDRGERDRGRRKSRDRRGKKKTQKKDKARSPQSSRSGEKQKKKRARSRGESPVGGREKDARDKGKVKEKSPKRSSSSSSHGIEDGQVTQRKMFRGTALDLSARSRRRVQRKAQRFLKKKKSSSSGSESSEGSREVSLKESPLFGDELKIRGVAERFPGLLAAESLKGISRMVASDMGDSASSSKAWSPHLVRYYRQVLSRRISGAMGRELLTHCSVIDSLLEGKIAQALDISLQRIKGLELQAGGTSYQVSQRLEVIPSEIGILPSRQEMAIIQKERNQEARAFSSGNYGGQAGQGKGKSEGRGDRPQYKGKESKGKGKVKSEGKKTEDPKK